MVIDLWLKLLKPNSKVLEKSNLQTSLNFSKELKASLQFSPSGIQNILETKAFFRSFPSAL